MVFAVFENLLEIIKHKENLSSQLITRASIKLRIRNSHRGKYMYARNSIVYGEGTQLDAYGLPSVYQHILDFMNPKA